MSESPWVVDVGEPDFETAVLNRSMEIPVVVDFWAPWCQPCRMLGPVLEKLADEYAGKFLLAKVNVDDSPMLAHQFGVSGIPQVTAIYQGKIVGQFSGVQPESSLRTFLDQIIPSEGQMLLQQAADVELTDPAKAKELYELVLSQDPKNTIAAAALAEMALNAGDLARAQELLSGVYQGSDGWDRAQTVLARLEFQEAANELGAVEECRAKAADGDLSAQRDLGLVLAANGQFEEALETLVNIVEKDREFGSAHVRELMVKIFNVVGPQSQLANTYRSRLASALY